MTGLKQNYVKKILFYFLNVKNVDNPTNEIKEILDFQENLQ